ncbi:hypothetical protein [Streptomyces sp. NBC_00503]|uniref:hypothetical protein n=1 Tax=Streptomyces sp. NBC_00503 TaxID=2903659 RepID=UPI002E80BBF6|nr:hypothetical protein [Streptomyces sp. NBC_00503]WUD81800.1 hypothetical protein OG490_15365 [Streptomyces sp. NBC_00503]
MDVAALVTAGATTIVGLMASDAWNYASGRFARLLGRTDDRARAGADGGLRASRAELLLARADGDEAAVAQVEEGWRNRLRLALEADPQAVRELTELLDEVNPGWREAASTSVVQNTITGGTFNGTVIQGRDFGSTNPA